MGSILLIGAGNSSSESSGGSAALQEIFHILYKVGTDPASAVFGKHTLTYDAVETASFTDYLSAAAAAALLETVYNDVSVTLINKGYRVAVVDPTGNIADPTATPSDTYVLNDGTGSAPNKTSQRDYAAPVSEVKERFELQNVVADTESATISNGSASGSASYDDDGNITSEAAPSGFATTGGGVGTGGVTWTQSSASEVADFTVTAGPGSISGYTQGVTGVAGATEVYYFQAGGSDGTFGFDSGYAGTVTAGVITDFVGVSGYTATSGGLGSTFVELTSTSTNTAVADLTLTNNDTGSTNYGVTTQGVTTVSEVAEQFTYTTGGPISRDTVFSNGGPTYTVTRVAGLITAISATPTGFSILSGGIGSDNVVFEQDVGAPVDDYINSSGPLSVTVTQQGVAAVAEAIGRCVIGYTGAAGYFTFADGFPTIVLSIDTSEADIKTALNASGGYNAPDVDTVTVDSTSITINYVTNVSPNGVITIGGRAGAAVAVSVLNIQEGT